MSELASPTLAEMCEKQGQWHKAASIWAQLLARDPLDETVLARFQKARDRARAEPKPVPAAAAELERWLTRLRGRFPALAGRH